MRERLDRRTVLAALGTTGALAVGAGLVRGQRPAYTAYTHVPSDIGGLKLNVAWATTYNGRVVAATDGSAETNATRITDPAEDPVYIREAAGPVVSLDGVLPGDSGGVVIGLLAEHVPNSIDGVDVWFRPTLGANLENGVGEPERNAPGEDDDGSETSEGELADALQVRLFLDDGLIGGCDGRFGVLDTALTPEASMREAFAGLENGVRMTDPCLDADQHRCLGLTWTLPASTGNEIQSDSVAFDLEFVGVGCGSGNPWGESA